MLNRVTRLLKSTPLYSAYRYYAQLQHKKNVLRSVAEWTHEDEHHKRFYSEFVKSGSIVFDVGANIGNRSKVFLALGATTVAFEPQPFCNQILSDAFGVNGSFRLERCALGEKPGVAEMFISEAHTISSMSSDWIADVRRSGRFSNYEWNKVINVAVDTLDNMISKYGVPGFIKIDVEGFEHVVLRGLSQAISALSIEFVPEHLASTLECIDRLNKLGDVQFRYTFWDHMEWGMDSWVDAVEIKSRLASLGGDKWGDLYARFSRS